MNYPFPMEKVTASSFLPHIHKPAEKKGYPKVGRNGRLSIHKPGVERKSMGSFKCKPRKCRIGTRGMGRKEE